MPSHTTDAIHLHNKPRIWWTNAAFFVSVHIAAFIGLYIAPPWSVKPATLILAFMIWQLADFGITIGYHRLYSHKALRASLGVRIVLAALGSAAFQGSIKWWCLRHRLHHRYTDDPVHDPYAATRGLFYSHMGWIFFKPTYDRIKLIEQDDLESDPVVRIQHKYYVPLALVLGFALPTLLGYLWHDGLGAFIWGGLISRLFIWHCTFLVNSLAHKDGMQPYSDEDTSRGNLILALLTGGEGNHNFHAFPHDFRSGPSPFDWDPSKWVIMLLHQFGLANNLRRANDEDIAEAIQHMRQKKCEDIGTIEDEWKGDIWNTEELVRYLDEHMGQYLVLIDGYAVNLTSYLGEHPGGASILRSYSMRTNAPRETWRKANWAFHGGLNNHSRSAKKRMHNMRIAKVENLGQEC